MDSLKIYADLLVKWQSRINLVSPATLAQAQTRHFDDSAQLATLIPEQAKILVDFGSGAGFPGLVLAMMRPDLTVHLIESDQKKCAFLQTVSRETSTPVQIHSHRIEQVSAFRADILTARALAPLSDLLAYAQPWFALNPDMIALFLKGRKSEDEITQAQARFTFEADLLPSLTDDEGRIIRITKLCMKCG